MAIKSFLTCLVVPLLICFSFSSLLGQSPQYENQEVQKIDVIVNVPDANSFDTKAITSRIKTKVGDFFSQTEFDNDLKILAKDFDRVDPYIQSINNQLHITLKIWPKPTIRSINWFGNEKVKTTRLKKELAISTCSIFDRLAFNKSFHKLKAYYVRKGFFEAELQYDVIPDPLTNEVDININIQEGRAGRIKEIIFVNFTDCERDELLDLVMTKKYNFFLSWWNQEGTFQEEVVQQDQAVILNYLQNKGYADAKVEIVVSEAKQENRIILTIVATKGCLYKIGNLTIDGHKIFCDEDIWKRIAIQSGDFYSPEKIRETIQSITDFYGRRGYIDAIINYEPRLVDNQHIYDLCFTIDEGNQFRVGLIKVFGNCSTQTNVILHETLLIPGEVFNTEKMKRTEERLQNIRYFKYVNVYAVKSNGPFGLGDNYRDVHIEVEETSTGRFGAFCGFSTTESVFGGANITEQNFNYKGLGCLWKEGFKSLRGGGEYLNLTATVGSKSRSYVLSWTKPYFNDTKWTVGFDLENSSSRYISRDYNLEATGFRVNAFYEYNQYVRIGWHYRLRNSYIQLDGDVPAEEAADRAMGEKGPSLVKESRIDGLISAIGTAFIYDSTNNPTRPTKGFKSRIEAEVAGVGGDHNFIGLAYLNNFYQKVDSKGVLKFKFNFNFLFPFGGTVPCTVPIGERLSLGGEDLIRGYRPYSLGPQFVEKGVSRGGMSMQLYSVEYNRIILKRLDAFVFLDSGSLTFQEGHFGRLFTAIGYGIKFQVFESAPPLTMGMGYPLNAQNDTQVKRFFLTVGGRF